MNIQEIKLGLCEGQHKIPEVTGYVFHKNFFNASSVMFDFDRMAKRIHEVLKEDPNVTLYVTGSRHWLK